MNITTGAIISNNIIIVGYEKSGLAALGRNRPSADTMLRYLIASKRQDSEGQRLYQTFKIQRSQSPQPGARGCVVIVV